MGYASRELCWQSRHCQLLWDQHRFQEMAVLCAAPKSWTLCQYFMLKKLDKFSGTAGQEHLVLLPLVSCGTAKPCLWGWKEKLYSALSKECWQGKGTLADGEQGTLLKTKISTEREGNYKAKAAGVIWVCVVPSWKIFKAFLSSWHKEFLWI